MEGMWTEYHENEVKKADATYLAGAKNGKWMYYNTQGKPTKEETWKKGTLGKSRTLK